MLFNRSVLLDFLFPKFCVSCKKIGGYLCSSCLEKIVWLEDYFCPVCDRQSINGITHPVCQNKFGLDGLISIASYKFPIREAILAFKYSFVSDITLFLVDLIKERVDKNFEGFVFSSVPLFAKRENWRGFNQSELLSRNLAHKLGEVYEDFLMRKRETKPQTILVGKERLVNIRDAFEVIKSPEERRVVLMDDVWTTGATLKECCRVLKKAGAKEVWALTLAR